MKYILLILLLLSIPTLVLSKRLYSSYKQQYFILSDFNSNNFERDIDYENIIDDFPNISVTTIPLSTLKAEYYFNRKDINQTVNLLHKGIKANPFLGRSEARLADIYYANNMFDSAIYYSNKAFKSLPLNSKHFILYLKSLAVQNKVDELDSAFALNFSLLKDINAQEQYFQGSMYFYLSTIYQYRFRNKKKYDSIARSALKLYPTDKLINIVSNFILYGQDSVQKAIELDNKAKIQFESKNYQESLNLFSTSEKFWPNQGYSLQQAGISAYLLGDYNKTVYYLEKLLKVKTPVDGLTELYLFNSYKNLGDKKNACKYLNLLKKLYPNLTKEEKYKCD